jgi:hypothetical protein
VSPPEQYGLREPQNRTTFRVSSIGVGSLGNRCGCELKLKFNASARDQAGLSHDFTEGLDAARKV